MTDYFRIRLSLHQEQGARISVRIMLSCRLSWLEWLKMANLCTLSGIIRYCVILSNRTCLCGGKTTPLVHNDYCVRLPQGVNSLVTLILVPIHWFNVADPLTWAALKHSSLCRLRLEDDLSTRVARIKTFDQACNERFARFSFWPEITGSKQFRKTKEGYTGLTYGTYLDSLMAEIPGASGDYIIFRFSP